MKKINFLLFLLVSIIALPTFLPAEDTVVITTYYPSPYGTYKQLYVSDKLGIGTTNPGYPLTITGSNMVIGGGYATVGRMYSGNDALFGHNVYADTGSRVIKQLNSGYYASWMRMYSNSGIYFGTSTAAGTAGDNVSDPAGTTNEKMVITNAGNVGIGQAVPVSLLDIQGGSANWNEATPGLGTGSIHLDPGVSTDHYGNAITWGASDSNSGDAAQAGIYVRSDSTYGTKMYLATTDAYVSGSKTRTMIDQAGNVGIGTTSPTQKLYVNGYIRNAHPWFCASSTDCWRAASGWLTVVHNTILAGNSGGWYSTSTGSFTAPVAGLYLFVASHYVSSGSSGATYIHHTIGVNGNWNGAGRTGNSGGYTIFAENQGNADSSTSQTALIYLNSGDTVQDNAYVSSSANYACGYHSFFQGVLIMATA